MDATNVSSQTGSERRKPTDLERAALIYREIDDIDRQIAGLYNLKKQKKAEIEGIWELITEKARRGQTIFEKEE